MEFTAQQIASLIGGQIEGDKEAKVNTFSKIEEGISGALTFLYDPKFEAYLYNTEASVVLVPTALKLSRPCKATLIRVDSPREALGKLLTVYEQTKPQPKGISPQAFIAPTAKIGKDVYIAPFAYVGEGATVGDRTQIHAHATLEDNVRVGNDCILYANATIYHNCIVGNRCILHSGCVIGADGFGFSKTDNGYEKIPQIGIAVLEDDVEIGANSCVDRAVMGQTIIRKDVKIDNLVQVGHNSEVKSHTVLCGQVGLAGSTVVGEWCTLTGQVGVAGHLTIADRTTAGAQAGILRNIKTPGQTIVGMPAIDAMTWKRSMTVLKRLPDIDRQVRELKKLLDELEASKKS
ncbi:MAG: UDP-3-O-(3-hydroxymyristoyl)glucosamine N-acyltransferase [Bacteroidaceae bacterium]|nr:UDP-3-O-(3-hydroxymyristoyl)glucosamine N-acyltransferase [Bacteroidaceae bacterium]